MLKDSNRGKIRKRRLDRGFKGLALPANNPIFRWPSLLAMRKVMLSYIGKGNGHLIAGGREWGF